jgi:NTE family protein
MKVGLVLGAGGVVGGAWLTGGLHALATETGWDPADADCVIGTSAGSMIGALCASGVPPWFMVAHSRGESFAEVVDVRGEPASNADRAAGAVYRPERAFPSLGPGSWSLALRGIAQPKRHPTAAVISAWLPKGMISTDPLREQIRRVVPEGWSPHPNLWIVTCDFASGERVVFGREGSPRADLADAVAASCAIPGFYHPVTIGGRRYVDGGVHSASNLDLLEDAELDVAICLNPTSTLHPVRAINPREWPNLVFRRGSGQRLGNEAKRVRAAGTECVLIQPTGDDLAVMGPNLMSTSRRNEVIAVATRTVSEQLRSPEVQELLTGLPQGAPEKVHRPDARPARWPKLRDLSERIRGRARPSADSSPA